jgi:hypothetical protein
MNAVESKWYRKKRLNIEHRWRDAAALHNLSETFNSPTEKYHVKVTPCAFHLERDWTYTVGKVCGPDGYITTVLRDFSSFPIAWCEQHPDGHDYLICGEDYQGQTVIRLDTGERVDYIDDDAENGKAFCWDGYEVSPGGLRLAVVGYPGDEVASPYEIRFLDFRQPFVLPYPPIDQKFVEYFDEMLGWEDEDRILISRREEFRTTDGAPLRSLTPEARNGALITANGVRNKRVVLSLGVDGSKHEVYSEWIPPEPPRKKKRE